MPQFQEGLKKMTLRQSQIVVVQSLNHVQLFATPWTVALQAPLFMEFSKQEYWSGLPFLSPGIKPMSLLSPALAGGFFTTELPGSPLLYVSYVKLFFLTG